MEEIKCPKCKKRLRNVTSSMTSFNARLICDNDRCEWWGIERLPIEFNKK